MSNTSPTVTGSAIASVVVVSSPSVVVVSASAVVVVAPAPAVVVVSSPEPPQAANKSITAARSASNRVCCFTFFPP
jgi:hypothetical protein